MEKNKKLRPKYQNCKKCMMIRSIWDHDISTKSLAETID